MPSHHALLSLLAFSLASCLAVLVDDTDPSIHYTPGTNWYLYTFATDPEFSWVDDPRVYNGSLHHSNCTIEDDCHARFTFTGVGITVNNVIRSTINVNMSVDQGPWTNFVFEDNLSCLNTDPAHFIQACYNRSTYISGPLTYGEHTLDIWMIGGDANHFNYADYFLDYLDVNDTNPNPPATTQPPRTSTVSSSAMASVTASVPASHPHSVVGAAVGGTIGGLALIAIILLVLSLRRRRRSTVNVDQPDPAFIPSPFSPIAPAPPATSSRSDLLTKIPPVQSTVPPSSQVGTIGNSIRTSSVIDQNTPAGSSLSAGQAEFVNDLYRMNVPSTAVASVISRMLQEDASGPTTVFDSTRTDDGNSIQPVPPLNAKYAPPPTYEP